MTRLGQEEEADLGDVRPGRDVDEVVLFLRIERVGARKVMERRVDAFEIPRVLELDHVPDDAGLRRCVSDIGRDDSGDVGARTAVEQLETRDDQILMLSERHRWSPAIPAAGPAATIEGRAQEAKDDELPALHS